VQVQLVLRLAVVADPLTAAFDDHRCLAENSFEFPPRFFWVFVAFGGEDEPEGEVLFSRATVAVEHADGRAEHAGVGIVGDAAGYVIGALDYKWQATR
jgi:hypothetical protein